jgi:hypothetical protein
VHDHKLFFGAALLLILPLSLAFFGHDQFRYPCQNPLNWEKAECKFPICDVTRTCPEQIFKGQRDPRLGPPPAADQGQSSAQSFKSTPTPIGQIQGANCGPTK